MTNLTREAAEAKQETRWWKEQVQDAARRAAQVLKKPLPSGKQAARFLAAVVDCVIVHACTGLQDVPAEFVDEAAKLPGESGLFGDLDRNETKDLRWVLDYWRSKPGRFEEFASLYYGYFLAVIADQLKAGAARVRGSPRLTITVMSDTNIVPLLAIYNLTKAASRRPPYLSALIHELYRHKKTRKLFIRVLYNGEVQKVCHGHGMDLLCPLEKWEELVARFTPSPEACPVLYAAYDFQAPRKETMPSWHSWPQEVWHWLRQRADQAGSVLQQHRIDGQDLALGALGSLLVMASCLSAWCLCRRRRSTEQSSRLATDSSDSDNTPMPVRQAPLQMPLLQPT